MNGILYIPYASGSCTKGFNYDKPLTSQQYVQMENKEYYDHKDGVDTMMTTRYGNNMSINMYAKRRFNIPPQQYVFHQCNCVILNIDGKPQNIEELYHFAKTQEQFIIILNLNAKTIQDEPDLESDLRMWFDESVKVKNCNRLSDVEVMFHLPKKDFKLKIEGQNETALLKDCKFLKFMTNSKLRNVFAIIVNKINFANE